MSYIVDYNSKIASGKILANDYIKRQYDQLANAAEKPKKYHLDTEISDRHIRFIETFCKQSQGVMGADISLELFQKAMLEAAFGFVDDNDLRQYTEVEDLMGRKNGKTTLCAGISLDMLCNDEEGAPEIYFIATKIDQAKKGFDEAERMRKHSPFLSKHIRKRGYDIYFPYNEGIIKPLASNVKKLDSYNSSCVIIDELGAITNRRIYDDMKQSMSSRRQPLLFCISSNNFVRDGIYDSQLEYGKNVLNGTIKDEHFLFLYYALEKKDQIKTQKYWIMANPGLGPIKQKKELKALVKKALNDPAFYPTVAVKDFNLTESPNSAWLPYEEAFNSKIADEKYLSNSYAVGGCDLSSTLDLTCATLILRKPEDTNTYVLQKYFLPESRIRDVSVETVTEAPYKLWADQGYIHVCDGASVNYHDVSMWFVEMVKRLNIRPLWIGYDRALAGYWVEEMTGLGFEMEKIAQGPYTWTYPFKQLRSEFKMHNIVYQNNPVLLWCLLNTGVKSANKDGIESQMPVKMQSNRRIDGTVSLLNAFTCKQKHEEEYIGYIK